MIPRSQKKDFYDLVWIKNQIINRKYGKLTLQVDYSFRVKIINLFLTFNFTLGGAEGEKNADKDDKFLTRSHPSPVNYFLEKIVKKGVANFRT